MRHQTVAKRAAFARRLKAARQESRLTEAELAEKVGVSQAAISRWELGERVPRDPFKVADALGVDPYWLIGKKRPTIKWATNGTGPK